jgi:hypothetical protein
MMHEQKTQRIIIVSNRLPVTVSVNNGAMSLTESVGGLATGLRSLLNAMENPFPFTPKYLWVGWPGNTINDDMKESVKSKLFFEHNSHPVFLSESDKEWLSKGIYDFILAIGDDWTDEDLFAVLPETAYSLHVGFNQTHARFHIRDPREVLRLIEQLVTKT